MMKRILIRSGPLDIESPGLKSADVLGIRTVRGSGFLTMRAPGARGASLAGPRSETCARLGVLRIANWKAARASSAALLLAPTEMARGGENVGTQRHLPLSRPVR
jgi:hypothetical protein